MAASFNGDFARLVPYNHLAQMLFSETVAYVDKNDTFHLQFINRTVTEPFRKSSEPVEESTEYDTYDTDTETSRFKNIQHSGHFVLSFTAERAPEMPHLGWRVGKGTGKMSVNRGVDLLLAKPGDILSKSLASIHLLLLFNPKSGFLMLKGASTKAIVEFKTGGMWEKLEYGEQRLMHQHATMLRAGACEYELGYIIEEKQRRSYFKERDAFLERIHPNKNYVPPSFQKLPGDSCVQKGNYIEFGTQGSGGFGWITQGVDIKAGNPVAIKELRVNNHRSHLAAMAEVNMGRRFSENRGLLHILDARCEHGCPDSCCEEERFYIYMPLARSDFSVNFWQSLEIPRSSKLHWLREILEGIGTLHAMGIMHRDIRPKNMLIMSTEPPRASLCDYGKAIETGYATATTLGPIHTLAPEVWAVSREGPYTNKIDMWAYGYAVVEILGYSVAKYPGPEGYHSNNPPITYHRHQAILEMLRAHRNEVTEDEPLVDLISKLLTWNPGERLSADQALEHLCWNSIAQEHDEHKMHKAIAKEEPSRTKKTKTHSLRHNPTDTFASSLNDTQEFSQKTRDMIQGRLGT